MDYPVITSGKFKYKQSREDGNVLLLLHGLFGGLSNFNELFDYFKDSHRVVIPVLPIYELPLLKVSVSGLVDYIDEFVDYMGFGKVHVLGNSLGGHIAILYALKRSDKISSVILTGSSGLFESAMGSSYPRRGDYNYIKKKTEATFYDPTVATKELVDEVYGIVNDRGKGIRIIATAKSAVRHNLENQLHNITAPTCLIWGNNDTITPPFVAEKFNELIKNSELHFLDKCGHSPMMEIPEKFNVILADFLKRVEGA
ncbi:MAG TPA: alpha/beta hydrolase [Saprospiraceae bacterium]|mgnify:FL=1|nr:alpha/beta hydrolase [Saprospiraceae bacterium]HRP84251.1 alpha/beta hydrolase [Saprospiraceae bacterium]